MSSPGTRSVRGGRGAAVSDKTIDGVEVVPGLKVWDYDLNAAVVVVGPKKWSSPNGATWYYMAKVDGSWSPMMDVSRMWRRHPRTGEVA
jgi:hypothetical protein